jgi:hypothetical protein
MAAGSATLTAFEVALKERWEHPRLLPRHPKKVGRIPSRSQYLNNFPLSPRKPPVSPVTALQRGLLLYLSGFPSDRHLSGR